MVEKKGATNQFVIFVVPQKNFQANQIHLLVPDMSEPFLVGNFTVEGKVN